MQTQKMLTIEISFKTKIDFGFRQEVVCLQPLKFYDVYYCMDLYCKSVIEFAHRDKF